MIPLCVPSIKGNEWNYIKECLDTEWVSSAGFYVDQFENKISEYHSVKHAIATVNGTSALHLSLIIAEVGRNDEVIVPSITFIAPINAIAYCNATPVFMDADEYYNIDVKKTIKFINEETDFVNGFTLNKKTKKKIKAIIPVHVFGNTVFLDELTEICTKRNIKIIEDATESLGSFYQQGKFKNKRAGTIGTIGCLSFNGNKIITTGGGGMILTDDDEIARKVKYLSTQAKDDPIRYVHNNIGYNYRLTNIQAAMGVAQLEQLQNFIEIKQSNFAYYKIGIESINGISLAETPNYSINNHWMYAIQIDVATFGHDREVLMKHLSNHSIQTRPIWFPNHLQEPFADCQNYEIDNAINLYENTLNIPCSTNLTKDEIDSVIDAIKII